MAYNNYFPQFYPPVQPQYIPQPTANNGITWVQGENAAKSYPVGAGQSILLMDSENAVMYIKSTDQSGVPLPLRIFDYKERTAKGSEKERNLEPKADFISRNEFESFRNEIRSELKQARNNTVKKSDRKEDQ